MSEITGALTAGNSSLHFLFQRPTRIEVGAINGVTGARKVCSSEEMKSSFFYRTSEKQYVVPPRVQKKEKKRKRKRKEKEKEKEKGEKKSSLDTELA